MSRHAEPRARVGVPVQALWAMGLLVALLLAACGSPGVAGGQAATVPDDDIPEITVGGPVGEAPRLEVATPLELDGTRTRVIDRGHGDPTTIDDLFLLQLTLVDGRTGRTAISTYDEGQVPLATRANDDTLFPVLLRALTGLREGGRVLVAATAEDAYGEAGAPQYGIEPGDPVVMVADLVATAPQQVLGGPRGTPRRSPVGAPRLLLSDRAPTGLDFARAAKARPRRLKVITLVEGEGPPVPALGLATIDYLGQVYDRARPFEETWSTRPMTVALGANGVIKAWERALVGVPRGSRLLILTPPALAFQRSGSPPRIPGNATLAYVIDVLGVS